MKLFFLFFAFLAKVLIVSSRNTRYSQPRDDTSNARLLDTTTATTDPGLDDAWKAAVEHILAQHLCEQVYKPIGESYNYEVDCSEFQKIDIVDGIVSNVFPALAAFITWSYTNGLHPTTDPTANIYSVQNCEQYFKPLVQTYFQYDLNCDVYAGGPTSLLPGALYNAFNFFATKLMPKPQDSVKAGSANPKP